MSVDLKNKKILMVIAFKDFKDEEYFVPKEIFEQASAIVLTASDFIGTAVGVSGGEVNIDLNIKDAKAEDYDTVVFVGGPGAYKYLDNSDFHHLAEETVAADKVLGAICIAPAILAKAGVLSGKKATVWSNALDKSAIKILKENGAVFQDEKVVVDGKIVTADGPAAAKEFGEEMVKIVDKVNLK